MKVEVTVNGRTHVWSDDHSSAPEIEVKVDGKDVFFLTNDLSEGKVAAKGDER